MEVPTPVGCMLPPGLEQLWMRYEQDLSFDYHYCGTGLEPGALMFACKVTRVCNVFCHRLLIFNINNILDYNFSRLKFVALKKLCYVS